MPPDQAMADVLPDFTPALSATNETGEVFAAPETEAPASGEKPAVEPKAGAKGTETSSSQATEPPDAEVTPTDKDPAWYVKRIGDVVKQRETIKAEKAAIEARAKAAEERALQAAAELAAAREKLNPPKVEEALVVPKLEDFEDPQAYADAYGKYSVELDRRQQAKAAREAVDAEVRARATKAVEAENIAYKARIETAKTKYPDIIQVIESLPDVPLAMVDAAKKLGDAGVDVVYHLGKNPEEVTRIAKLDPVNQVIEMARLADRLAPAKAEGYEVVLPAGTGKEKTGAPKPPVPIKGSGNSNTVVDRESLPMEDYAKLRAGEGAKFRVGQR